MVPRRAVLAGLGAGLAGGPAARAADPGGQGGFDWAGLAARALGAIRASAAPLPGPCLLRSYEVRTGPDADAFDRTQANCAYVYDNAVAGLALLAAGDVALARRIGGGLRAAQDSDRFWRDGRLRNAYAAGPAEHPAKLPGWWDPAAGRWLEDAYQVGSATGVVAWAMLLFLALHARTGEAPFRDAAARAADWAAAQRGARGYQGGAIGWEPDPRRLTWTSTEHNVDLWVAFRRLCRTEDSDHALALVRAMWTEPEGRFLSGLLPDGVPNPHSAVDANLWPLLAAEGASADLEAAWRPALDWVLARHALPAGAPRAEVAGVDFNTDRDGIWMEGTAIAALALRRTGTEADAALAARLGATVAAAMTADGMVLATTAERLTTGLSTGLDPSAPDFLYRRRPHLAATAWAALAGLGANPLAG